MKITIAEGSWGSDLHPTQKLLKFNIFMRSVLSLGLLPQDKTPVQQKSELRSQLRKKRLSQHPQWAPIPASLLQKKSWESSMDTRTPMGQFGSTFIFKYSKSSTNRTNYRILLRSPGAFLRHLPPKQYKRSWNEPVTWGSSHRNSIEEEEINSLHDISSSYGFWKQQGAISQGFLDREGYQTWAEQLQKEK